MSDNRKYYYLKLKENYFDDDSIVLLESMQDGVLYGCVNNVSKKPRRIGGRWSVLDRLHIKQAERKQKEQPQQQQQERSRKN